MTWRSDEVIFGSDEVKEGLDEVIQGSLDFTEGQVKQRFGHLCTISEKSLTSVESKLVGVIITIVSLPYTFTSCSLTIL